MALEVVWTENALDDYRQVIDYLLQTWPFSVASEFISNTESRIETLSIFPGIGKASLKEPGIKSIVLTRHNLLYYKVSDDILEIINLFDTRQNPVKNKYG